MKVLILSLAIMALFLAPAQGQIIQLPLESSAENENADYQAIDNQAITNPTSDLLGSESELPVLKAIGGLGLVLCLIIGGFFGLKKFAPQYFAKHSSGKSLKVIETLSLGDRRSISLIRVGNSHFLVGNTPQQINFLATLPATPSSDSGPAAAAIPTSASPKASNSPKAAFQGLFEVEKNRQPPTLPSDIRIKMRQLSEALER